MSAREFKVAGWRAALIWYVIVAVLALPLEVIAFVIGGATA